MGRSARRIFAPTIAALAVSLCIAPYATAGDQGKTTPSTPPATAKKGEGSIMPDNTLIFFMNPNGRPCQMQIAILDGIKDKVAPLANVRYVKTTVDADYEAFSQYGIRSLPALMIVDKGGKEIKRFTPGIQNEDVIMAGLKAAGAVGK